MKYHGGKARIASQLKDEVFRYRRKETRFVSLFCGALSLESAVAPYFKEVVCSDSHPYLIAFWRALRSGWKPPDFVSEEEYRYIRENKDENPALTGFCGFGLSFGGKFFGGYAKSKDSSRDYVKNAINSSLRKIIPLKNAVFSCTDYRNVPIRTGDLVYCDPPYHGTRQGYEEGTSKPFDTTAFWKYIRELSRGVTVLISEEKAPNDFVEVWSKEELNHLRRQKDGKQRDKRVEKLFISEERLALLNMGGSTWDVDAEKVEWPRVL